MDFHVNLNLLQNELQNAVIQPLASAPSSPKLGQIYYNSGDKVLYQYDGTQWKAVGTVSVTSVNGKTGVVVLTQDDVGDGTTYVRTHNDLTDALVTLINGALPKSGGTMSGAIAMGGSKITGLGTPTASGDAATKDYVDAAATGALKPKGSVTFANLPQLSASVLNNLYNVTDAFTTTADFVEGAGVSYPAGTNVAIINTGSDASPVYKYDAMPGVIDLSGYLQKSGGTMTGNLAMGSNKITGLAAPTADGDAANKKYVDDAISGISTVSSATGTIGTSATSASVSYSGTLINAYALQGGEKIMVDIAVTSSAVTFSVAAAPSTAITCVVIYV